MNRGGPLKRKTRLRPVSAKKKAKWIQPAAPVSAWYPPGDSAPVRSTTARTPSALRPKDGRFECRALLDFHKRGECAGCGRPADDPSHYPSRGAGGDDLGCYPICRPCHGEAQQYRGRFTPLWQELEAGRALVRFIRAASPAERLAFVIAWDEYAAGRVFAGVPW